MTKTASTPDLAKMEAALKAVATELDDATDILHYQDGQPVTALEGWQIQRIFDGLRSVMVQVDEALNQDAPKAKPLPSDPEGMNNDRAEWAAAALRKFQSTTGTDCLDALADLLGDLMHWADRNAIAFDDELSRARTHYEAETRPEDTPAAPEAGPAAFPSQPPIKSEVGDTVTTKTYKAEYFTAADYAFRNFEAETPEQALRLARQFYDDNLIELDFRSYDDNAGLDQIDIWHTEQGAHSRLVLRRALTWESEEFRLRQAAPELLAALKDLHHQLECFGMDTAKMPSLTRCKAAITKAEKGRQQ